MKIKYLAFILFIIFIISSCYQDGGNNYNNISPDSDSGKLSLQLRGPSNPEAGDKIRLYFFKSSEIYESDFIKEDQNFGSYGLRKTIGYSDYVFNYVKPLQITGTKEIYPGIYGFEFTNPADFTGQSISIIDGIPANSSFKVLIEYYGIENFDLLDIYGPDSNLEYFLTHAGVSNSFTVIKDFITPVSITVDHSAYGNFIIENFNEFLDGTESSVSLVFVGEEDFSQDFTVSGNSIQYNNQDFPYLNANPLVVYYYTYLDIQYLISYSPAIPMLPGRKLKLMVIKNEEGQFTAKLINIPEINPGQYTEIELSGIDYVTNFC